MSAYVESMGWQSALVIACLLLIAAAILIVGFAALRDWHDRNYRRIPREDLISHRVTPRLPFGDWK